MYVKMDVPKPGTNAGTGLKAKGIITLIDIEDILSMPPRDDKGVLLDGAIVLKPGKYAIKIYATQDTIKLESKSEGDTDNEGFSPVLTASHPGNKQAIREFKTNNLGKHFIAIVDYCDGKPKDVIGSECEPVKLGVNFTGDKDKTVNEFTLTQIIKGNDIAMYNGTIPYAVPVAVIAAGATTIALAGEGEYQLTGDVAAADITAVTGAVHGMLFTLIGAPSGTAPTIDASSTFVLKDGETWTGTAGSQITFQAVKSGANAFAFIEKSRA